MGCETDSPPAGQVSLDASALKSIELLSLASEPERECHWLKMERTRLDQDCTRPPNSTMNSKRDLHQISMFCNDGKYEMRYEHDVDSH